MPNTFGTLNKVMENKDQQCLGLFLLELKRHMEKLLQGNNTATRAHQQRTITTPTHATRKSRATRVAYTSGL